MGGGGPDRITAPMLLIMMVGWTFAAGIVARGETRQRRACVTPTGRCHNNTRAPTFTPPKISGQPAVKG